MYFNIKPVVFIKSYGTVYGEYFYYLDAVIYNCGYKLLEELENR